MKSRTSVAFLTLFLALHSLFAQAQTDSVVSQPVSDSSRYPLPYHKNVIKFNPTPMLILGEIRNITLAYERMITRNQSVSIQLGYLIFPRLFDDTIVNIVSLSGRSKYGVNIALDYRYYPGARNRRPAPDGIYIGGYLSYYGFKFSNHFDILYSDLDQNGQMHGRLNFFNAGLQLGYQFVFWKRFTVDLLMFGPSLSYYSGYFAISGDLDEEQINEIDDEIVQAILNRFPALKTIFSTEELEFTGNRSKLSIGFRYSITLGFHF